MEGRCEGIKRYVEGKCDYVYELGKYSFNNAETYELSEEQYEKICENLGIGEKSSKIEASPELLTLKEIASPLVWKEDAKHRFGGEWVCPRCGSKTTMQILYEYEGEYCIGCGQKIVTYDDPRDFATAYPSRGYKNP